MATTSIHIPEALLEALDQVARERGVSRNRIIVEACRRELSQRREWPPAFFDNDHLSPEELAELRGADDFSQAILAGRRNRPGSPI
jgi:hypothetical protein